MPTITHEPARPAPERRSRPAELLSREAWAGLAIIVMWLAVLFDALYGPDVVSTSSGGDSSTIPSAVFVALFASLATWIVAKYGFGRRGRDGD